MNTTSKTTANDAEGHTVFPNNLEYEYTVLGSVMADPGMFHKLQLSLSDFWDLDTRAIWAVISKRLTNSPVLPVDPMTLISDKSLDTIAITRCVNGAIGEDTAMFMAGALRHLDMCRKVARESSKLVDMALAMEDEEAIVGALEASIATLTSKSDTKYATEEDAATSAFERYCTRKPQSANRIDFGLPTLDGYLFGIRGGRLYTIAGRPGDGKSALALKLIDTAIRDGKRVNFHSLEMSQDEIMDRWVSMRSGIKHGIIAHGQISPDIRADIQNELDGIAATKNALRMYCTGTQTVSKIYGEMRRSRPHLVVIDYLQLIHGPEGAKAETRDRELSKMTSALKSHARDMNCAVVMLSQLNRSIEKRDDPMPQLADLRESGGIESDSDVVIFCVRNVAAAKKGSRAAESEKQSADTGVRLIRVAKNRHGQSGNVLVRFDFSCMRVNEIADEYGDG